ncbi:Membrane protein insertase YidC [Desulfamplus magnetovallimortis]|uniref:Membrane protein insertase YidC n=1 Tax=Desulfamplus magnetovallimortis TaxID=1246637 RepID=A0A1W1H779_9BACT|nr:membrane protein insertase YidC [Desulfamplus magnetovallimortis]SLM28331.1 Membrane protein insertase YidC [Desulfamplus magnetovallimortis]
MEEQKRLFIAIILSVVVIAGWNLLFVDPVSINQQPVVDGNSVAENRVGESQSPSIEDFQPENGSSAYTNSTAGAAQQNLSSEPEIFRTLTISTPLYNAVVSEKRAAVTSMTLKGFREGVEEDSPLKQMVTSGLPSGLFAFDMEGKSLPGLDRAVFKADRDTESLTISDGESRISFSWRSPHGIVVEKIYTFSASSYMIGMELIVKNGSTMPLKDSLEIVLPFALSKDASSLARFGSYGPAVYLNGALEEIKPDDIEEKNNFQGIVEWVGNADRYFISTLLPVTPVQSSIKLVKRESLVLTSYIQSMDRLDPGKQVAFSFNCYMGPKSLKVLSSYDNSLKKSINFGWFDVLAKPCLIAMNLIHDFIPNYGIAIIILTILIKLLFWPLGTKSYKSMNDMRKLTPLMTEIREKYKDDKQKMNQEVMSLYKTYKVNPMSGCLPMLVQMPIFFALYRMLYQAIELRHAPFMGWINDLSAPDRLFDFAVSIPFMQPPYGIPVLTLIMGATMFLQQKMTPTTGDPTQAKMMMFMPLFMTFIFINFPAGLVLYWLVNNVLSIGQQYYIQKKFS